MNDSYTERAGNADSERQRDHPGQAWRASRIADYALLGNLRCAALVARNGAIDWYCPGRFDAPACFSALLGGGEHGHWQIQPRDGQYTVERRYQPDTLVLETCFTAPTGTVTVTDFMPVGDACHIYRLLHCTAGSVPMQMHCAPRFGYGRYQPGLHPAGSDDGHGVDFEHQGERLALRADGATLDIGNACASACFRMTEGERIAFVLTHASADHQLPHPAEPGQALVACRDWWRQWIGRSCCGGRWEAQMKRSLITLKALTYEPAGGMVAAPTTSLPEVPGGRANYDYRFCWLRDAAFALRVLLNSGYKEEARAWCDWLVNAMGQHDKHLHALYTVEGRVAPEERELHWLPGYRGSRPVRCGNAASHQYQLDLRGELAAVLHLARNDGLELSDVLWQLQCRVMERLGRRWREPDTGIWEFRTMCEQLTHSKVLAWAAYDRSIADADSFGLPAPVEEWRRQRDAIREDILRHGVDPVGGHFTQRYGSPEVDASLLMIPLVEFLPAGDPRMLATVAAIERDLCEDGLVRRYRTGDQANVEGVFLACCFWLVDNYWLAGRKQEAVALFERLVGLGNDVGLLAEEYDVRGRQLLGNFPQGLSHLALVSSARLMTTRDEEEVELE